MSSNPQQNNMIIWVAVGVVAAVVVIAGIYYFYKWYNTRQVEQKISQAFASLFSS